MLFTNKKNKSIEERANTALATVQQNAYAMNILRSSFESQINFIISIKGNIEDFCQELAWVLELVKKSEIILNAISDSIESAHYLEESITIINNAVLYISELRHGINETIGAAEASLSELNEVISKVPTGPLPDLRQEVETALLAELSTVLAAAKTYTAKGATVTWTLEKQEGREEEEQEQPESVMA